MLASTTRGHGAEAAIMLHGFLGSGRNLGMIARRWSVRDPNKRVLMPDLTGHGESPALPPNADLSTLANDVLALGRSLKLAEPWIVVGHSLGGRVALRLKLLAPEAIARTVLLDITPARLDDRPTDMTPVIAAVLAAPDHGATRGDITKTMIDRGLSKGLVDWLAMNLIDDGSGGYRWRIDRKALAALLDRTREEDLWAAVDSTVRLVWGERSNVVPIVDREELEKRGGGSIAIPGAGHFLHAEKPEAVLDAIIRP